MFRRIELIKQSSPEDHRKLIQAMVERGAAVDRGNLTRFWKTGIMGSDSDRVIDAWFEMNSPRRMINKNCRFYFTEAGWKRYGRPTVIACQKTGQEYRVIAIKEKSADIFYRDEIQVAVRPKKEKC